MANAKNELLAKIKEIGAQIKCAFIAFGGDSIKDCEDKIFLKVNHDESSLNRFLNKINFEYDDGYGGQFLYGTVWLDDGSWLERGEYDGSEWWEHKTCPDIPNECK